MENRLIVSKKDGVVMVNNPMATTVLTTQRNDMLDVVSYMTEVREDARTLVRKFICDYKLADSKFMSDSLRVKLGEFLGTGREIDVVPVNGIRMVNWSNLDDGVVCTTCKLGSTDWITDLELTVAHIIASKRIKVGDVKSPRWMKK